MPGMEFRRALPLTFMGATRAGQVVPGTIANGVWINADAGRLVSATTSTSIANLICATVGVKQTHHFELPINDAVKLWHRLRFNVHWQITLSTCAAGTGRINVDVTYRARGAELRAISGLTQASGPAVSLIGVSNTTDANLIVDVPAIELRKGDILNVQVEFEVVSAAGAGEAVTWQLHHNPIVAADALWLDVDW